MGIAAMEELVKTVGAILKTLECPICLETLKTPVSAGCGHFFCKECASGILHLSYRAPCPLCKRSFTRRSIQEAGQRQTVITAAKALAQTCSSLTGVDIIPHENVADSNRKSLDALLDVPAKAFKTITKENQELVSKKRKSCENEGNILHVDKDVKNSETKETLEENETSDAVSNNEGSSTKRVCHDSDDDSIDLLPSLDTLLSRGNTKQKCSEVPAGNKVFPEKPLSIIPSDKVSNMKTYSRRHKSENKFETNAPKVIGSCKSDVNEELGSKIRGEKLHFDKDESSCDLGDKSNKNEVENSTSKKNVKLKNKINALKNKTNEVEADQYILQDDCFLAKPKDVKEKLSRTEQKDISKENELHLSPSALSNLSPSKHSSPLKVKRKLRERQTKARAASNASTNEELNSKLTEAMKHRLVVEKASSADGNDKDIIDKECYNLNEVNISKANSGKQCKNIRKISSDDPFALTDTAVSVDAVPSPLAAKSLSLNKSPGWSHFKKVKKDFKVKKFPLLNVEKNSPYVSKISSLSLDPVAVEDESVSSTSRFDTSVGAQKELVESQRHDNEAFISNTLPVKKISSKKETYSKQFDLLLASKGSSKSVDNEQCIKYAETVDSMDIDIHDNLNKSEMHNGPLEEMDCSNNFKNTTGRKEKSSSITVPNSSTKKNISENAANCYRESNIAANENVNSAGAIVVDPVDNHNLLTTNDNFQNMENSRNITEMQNLNELPKSSTLNDVICEDTDFNENEQVISKQAFVYDYTKQNQIALCGSETPKIRKQSSFYMQTRISNFQNFHAQSVNEDNGLQYVEHSQQTSQLPPNFDNLNPLYNNFALAAQPLPLFHPNLNRETEKTKVVKRTCLTLEEIQDCFLKSSRSNSAETICTVPFLSGQFKLHVGVSEETLNISVLKVIDPSLETCSAYNGTSIILDKGIQTSNSLFHLMSPTVLPPSNSSSQPDNSISAPDPFPYLNRYSDPEVLKPVIYSVDETHDDVTEFSKGNNSLTIPEKLVNQDGENFERKENVSVKDIEMSEIVNFSNKSVHNDHNQSQNRSDMLQPFNIAKEDKNMNKAVEISENEENAVEDDIDMSEIVHFPKQSVHEDHDQSQEYSGTLQPFNNTLEKENINRAVENFECEENAVVNDIDMSEIVHFPNQSVHEDHDQSQKHSGTSQPFNNALENENMNMDHLTSYKGDTAATTMPFESVESDDSLEHISPVKEGDTKEVLESDDGIVPNNTSCRINQSESKVADPEGFSDSDKDSPLKILQHCANKGASGEKKKSRLSLKKKSKFRRTQIFDSSDESDDENPELVKSLSKEKENACLASGKLPDHILSEKNFIVPKEPMNTQNIKNTMNSSAAGLDMPCTLNSVLSEDGPENNASDIILEIEDLADKIKSLEDKLKQCGHADAQKSQKNQQTYSNDRSNHLSGNSNNVNGSDSEDSIDLFPQSVPPTPPGKCGNDANSSYKSSFYK